MVLRHLSTTHRLTPHLPRLAHRPLVMGILNVTPDSFSDGGLCLDPAAAVEQGRQMAAAGADCLDVGGESTRPGASPVSVEEELQRVLPVIRGLAAAVRVPISIDTSKAAVAAEALAAGATIVNDVTALRDPAMAAVIARARASVILMHMRGSPGTMQHAPRYHHLIGEVSRFLRQAARQAAHAGIAPNRIFLDPGLGFGKTVQHNLALLQALPRLTALGCPLVLGPSRKSFIGRVLDVPVDERLPGTLACLALAHRHGVRMVRVHDVAPAVGFLRMLSAIADTRLDRHR